MSHGSGPSRTIGVEGLARVEGEGSLRVEVRDGEVTDVALEIFEPPRYFEALLVGRHFTEAPDITARICGICPVAYQMSACAAMEDACGVTRRRTDQSPAAAPLLRRVDPEPRPSHLPAPRPRLPRLCRRGGAGRARPGALWSGACRSSGPATWSWRRWAAGPCIRSTSGSAASTGRPDAEISCGSGRAASPGPRRRAGHRGVGGRLRLPRRRRRLPLRGAARRRPLRHRARPAGVLRRPRREPRRVGRPRRRGARGPLHRSARPSRRARPVPHGPLGPVRAQRSGR